MEEFILIEHNYPLYIFIWILIVIFLFWFFRFMPNKMKQIEDPQTKNSLYTITIFIGIPLLILCIIAPPFFIIGDKNMDPFLRYLWISLIVIFIIYFFLKQKAK